MGAKRKPIYAVMFVGGSGTACQTVKAVDSEEAERKFLKAYPKKNKEENILDIDIVEPTHKHYLILAHSAI